MAKNEQKEGDDCPGLVGCLPACQMGDEVALLASFLLLLFFFSYCRMIFVVFLLLLLLS